MSVSWILETVALKSFASKNANKLKYCSPKIYTVKIRWISSTIQNWKQMTAKELDRKAEF